MYPAKQVANYILTKTDSKSGDNISPLKLQKLLYYCQSWHLAVFKEPLFEDEIQAWAKGPVVVSQYARFANTRIYDRIDPSVIDGNVEPTTLEGKSKELVDDVLSLYGEHTASYLEKLTHTESPWIDARKRDNAQPHEASTEVITWDEMKNFYTALLASKKQ